MGLECLSRGATRATFFEADRSALSLLKENIQTLSLEGHSAVIRWRSIEMVCPHADGSGESRSDFS